MAGYVGPELPGYEWVNHCLYTGLTPGQVQCGKPAVVHLFVVDPTMGDVALQACAEHEPIARAAGEVIDEHPIDAVCGMPGSVWLFDDHRCDIDDSGVELPAKVAEAVSVP